MNVKNKLKVDFIDVGQGDCIVLNWLKNDGSHGIGLIDCADFDKCIYWLSKKDLKEIDFILLSHPHSDHFSGMPKLLSYLKKNNIKVKEIMITFSFGKKFLNDFGWTQDDFVENVVYENAKRTELYSFLEEIARLHKNKEAKIHIPQDRWCVKLNSKLTMRCLGPESYDTTKTFIATTIRANSKKLNTNLENDFKENPSANILSSTILIESDFGKVLLTSDITTKEKERILDEYLEELNDVLLMQVPHHGSNNGFSKKALSKFVTKNDCIAIISVGPNNYKHPKQEVTSYYIDNFKKLYLTSNPDRIKENFKLSSDSKKNFKEILDLLDLLNPNFSLSDDKKNIELDGSKSFMISENGCQLVDIESII